MISVEQALSCVLDHRLSLPVQTVPLLQATGRVLAQNLYADRDFPPFDRVTMDGFALRASAFIAGTKSFSIQGVQAAGEPAATLQEGNLCVEIMTGAVLPLGADAVVPYEQCRVHEGVATVLAENIVRGQNIHVRGTDGTAGDLLLSSGTVITPPIIGTIASVGWSTVPVYQLPKVAICSTGDELVEIDQTPLPHQIRRSNVYMLAAALLKEHIQANLFHLPDEPAAMERELNLLLAQHDVLLCSGAVSKGRYDYLPQVLEKMGLQKKFHAVAQKPGKPLLFGTLPGGKVVFGLPGNPVSTLVCYQLYVRPWLLASLRQNPDVLWAQLSGAVTFTPALSYHLPVTISTENGVLSATPISSSGSGDMTSLLKAQALLTLPPDKTDFAAGEAFAVTLL